MKNFRIARCLVDGKINEYAIFEDKSEKKLIQTHKKYGKYFEVDNEFNTENIPSLERSFNGRIKDVIVTVAMGDADCPYPSFYYRNSFDEYNDKVVYFIDREIGESLRKEFLEKYDGVSFKWTIACADTDELNYYKMIDTDHSKVRCSVYNKSTPMIFDTAEEAQVYVDLLLNISCACAKTMVDKMISSETMEDIDNVTDIAFPAIKAFMGNRDDIVFDLIYDIINNDSIFEGKYELNQYRFRVIQYADRN